MASVVYLSWNNAPNPAPAQANWSNWEACDGNFKVLQCLLCSSVWFMIIMLFLWSDCVCFMTQLWDKGSALEVMDTCVSMVMKITSGEPHCSVVLLYYFVTVTVHVCLSLHGLSTMWLSGSGAWNVSLSLTESAPTLITYSQSVTGLYWY